MSSPGGANLQYLHCWCVPLSLWTQKTNFAVMGPHRAPRKNNPFKSPVLPVPVLCVAQPPLTGSRPISGARTPWFKAQSGWISPHSSFDQGKKYNLVFNAHTERRVVLMHAEHWAVFIGSLRREDSDLCERASSTISLSTHTAVCSGLRLCVHHS